MRPFAAQFDSASVRVERLAMARIGEHLRRTRDAKGITLRALAAAVGLSAPFLSDVEHGRRRLSHLAEICKVLGVKQREFTEIAGTCPHCHGTGMYGVQLPDALPTAQPKGGRGRVDG